MWRTEFPARFERPRLFGTPESPHWSAGNIARRKTLHPLTRQLRPRHLCTPQPCQGARSPKHARTHKPTHECLHARTQARTHARTLEHRTACLSCAFLCSSAALRSEASSKYSVKATFLRSSIAIAPLHRISSLLTHPPESHSNSPQCYSDRQTDTQIHRHSLTHRHTHTLSLTLSPSLLPSLPPSLSPPSPSLSLSPFLTLSPSLSRLTARDPPRPHPASLLAPPP